MGQRAYDQYLERRYRETKESIDFFSDQNKAERERCIVRAFFRCLGVSFTEKDLQVNQLEPIDVAALGGRFQVTEVLAPSRNLGDLKSPAKCSYVDGLELIDLQILLRERNTQAAKKCPNNATLALCLVLIGKKVD